MNVFTARPFSILFVLAVLVTMTGARADPISLGFGSIVQVEINNANCNPTYAIGGPTLNNESCGFSTAPLVADTSRSNTTGASGQAHADLANGAVSIQVTGNNQFGGAYAYALVWDTLTFSGALPGARATLTMTGTWGGTGDARIYGYGDLVMPIDIGTGYGPDPNPLSTYNLWYGASYFNFDLLTSEVSRYGGSCCGRPQPVAFDFLADTYTLTQSFAIYNDVPMFLLVGVWGVAGSTGTGNPTVYQPPGIAFITDPFSLGLPAGVTFTSASEDFSAAAPEPSTWLLLGAGLAGLTAWRRRKTTRAAPRE